MAKTKTKTTTKSTETTTTNPPNTRARRNDGGPPPLPMVSSPQRMEKEIRKAKKLKRQEEEAEARAREMDEEERQIQEADRRVEELARARAERGETRDTEEENVVPSAPPLPQDNPPPSYDALGPAVKEEVSAPKSREEEGLDNPGNVVERRVFDQTEGDQSTVISNEGNSEEPPKVDLNKSKRVADVKRTLNKSEQLLERMTNIRGMFSPNRKVTNEEGEENNKPGQTFTHNLFLR